MNTETTKLDARADCPAASGALRTQQPKAAEKTKAEILQKLLSRRTGATIAQVQRQLDWQPHTVRAAISRLRSSGLSIELDRSGKAGRYRLVSGGDR